MPPHRSRQFYLGPSPQGTLCLIPRPPQLPPKALGKCYIHLLPNELLADIMAYLPPKTVMCAPPTYEQCPPIPLVCKRWECIYDATLYRTISFGIYPRWQQHRTAKVLKILRQKPDLRRHVRNISVQSRGLSEATCRQIAETIKTCQAIHTVSLHLRWPAKIWPIIHAAEMLPRLVVLRLSEYDSGPSLQMNLAHFNQSTLRDVKMDRYGLGSGGIRRARSLPIESPLQDGMKNFAINAHSHSSSITSLELNNPCCLPSCIGFLLQWPSNLTRLSLSGLTTSAFKLYYTLDTVEHILNFHRESLQHISLSMIPGRQSNHHGWIASGIPDLSKFQSLRELQLSSHNLLEEEPSQANAKLPAPALRHLPLDFRVEERHLESCRVFAEDQLSWMAHFARQNQIREPNTRLQSIFIDFDPGVEALHLDDDVDKTWPWYYLQKAKKELSRYDLTMRYSDPAYTKDEWDQRRRKKIEAKRVW